MNKKIFYIGKFPQPYGGATLKNDILYKELLKYLDIDKFDTVVLDKKAAKPFSFVKLLLFILKNSKRKGIICIASFSLFKLTKIIAKLNKNILRNITVFTIGGIINELIVETNQDLELYKMYKNIYVESEKMKKDFNRLGLKNVEVIPNCRPKTENRKYCKMNDTNKLKCLFISRICEEKGVKTILQCDKLLNNKKTKYQIDFYGPVADDIKEYFNNKINESSQLTYKGIFKANEENVYDLIKEYDVLLFPTKHIGEGFPGILAEAKIAGIPIIASDWRYNSDIVNHLEDGIILKENTPEKLSEAIEMLYYDRKLLHRLRKNSYDSGENYFIENYSKYIIDRL